MTMMNDLPEQGPFIRDDDEGLFSRDIDGQLVRVDTPTEDDYGKQVTVSVDGRSVTVPVAEPLKDAQGNIVLDVQGRTTPRYTTIYDAIVRLYVKKPGDEAGIPVPILCHQPHMNPVAVCRLCVVQIYGQKRGKRTAERKLFPACQHQVRKGMEVFTMESRDEAGKRTPDGERVWQSVKVLTQLLTSDHLQDAPAPAPAAELSRFNELKLLTDRCGLAPDHNPFREASAWKSETSAVKPVGVDPHSIDRSSPVFLVDHSACILCDRCSRACDEVKNNQIIGRTGKGPTAGIGFDLDDPMGESGCVQCGECMVSCPTSAITFNPVTRVKPSRASDSEVLTAVELVTDPLFVNVPPKFLVWQDGLAVRRRVKAGEVLCHQGDPGNTAYLIRSGKLQVTVWPDADTKRGSFLTGLLHRAAPAKPVMQAIRTPADIILGEMACLSGTPRTAEVRALEDGEVWEVRRNVLDRLMRSPSLRQRFETIYRNNALDAALRRLELFKDISDEERKRCADYLRPRLSFVRVSPGQVVFRTGEWADCLYLVRLGHVRVVVSRPGREDNEIFRGPGTSIGEIGLLALSPEDAAKSYEQVDAYLAEALADGVVPSAQRTATCIALDHLELARVGRTEFAQIMKDFPKIRMAFVKLAIGRLRGDLDDRPMMREYVEQGLYQGQSLLVMDLNRCTHCDECTRACVQQHGTESHGAPLTRLLRTGLTFENFLVATSCRSCKDAYCMIGCPVDSIHRGKHQQIVIEDHCIGCGLCATNCPFGNIWLAPNENRMIEHGDPDGGGPKESRMVAQMKAATCDLCDAEGERDVPLPRCVYACPHDAAHRMSGTQLLKEVIDAKSRER